MIEDIKLDHYISTKGCKCRVCGDELDTKTTITMLCSKCKHSLSTQKQRESFKAKYGVDNPMRVPEIVNKIQTTMKERYGKPFAMQIPEFKQKMIDTCKQRYGTSYYVNHPDFVQNSSCKSKINEKFAELLRQNSIEFEMEKECEDKRFDFKLKNIRTYIEIDPTYTHNVAGNHWDTDGLPKTQQLVKTLIAEKHGYRCIHVFDWDDWDDIIQLVKPVTKIYARNCEVRVIQDNSFNKFIDDNHIQKSCKGTKIALGLYSNDELVQVMTFGKPRYNANYIWELLRLCSRRGIIVVGGASKLFHYATSVLGINSIISYCDRSKFSGRVYLSMGMTLLRESDPHEIWSKGSAKITGSLLRQRGYDQLFGTNYGKGTSNEKLMLESGWLPVYDCGQFVYTYGPPKANKEEDDINNISSIDYSRLLRSIDKKKERICKFCGEPFVPNSNMQIYCKRPHYMTCPVCGKQYLVTNNENLKRPPVACSYECRKARREQTSLTKYGIKTPGNNPQARQKAVETMQSKYGVDYAMQNPDIRKKSVESMLEKYGVDNIKKLNSSVQKAQITRQCSWLAKIDKLLPYNFEYVAKHKYRIDETKMKIYLLNERVSKEFLSKYGFNLIHKFGKIHLSVGLVDDNEVYQVIRFERNPSKGDIILAEFGTKADWYNPNGYSKLMEFATKIRGIDSFKSTIPKYISEDNVTIKSLGMNKISERHYDAYWVQDDKSLKKVTTRDDIESMLTKYKYVTSDWLYDFEYSSTSNDKATVISEIYLNS